MVMDGALTSSHHFCFFSILLGMIVVGSYFYQGLRHVGTVNASEHMIELGIEGFVVDIILFVPDAWLANIKIIKCV